MTSTLRLCLCHPGCRLKNRAYYTCSKYVARNDDCTALPAPCIDGTWLWTGYSDPKTENTPFTYPKVGSTTQIKIKRTLTDRKSGLSEAVSFVEEGACLSSQSGSLRIKASHDACKANEFLISREFADSMLPVLNRCVRQAHQHYAQFLTGRPSGFPESEPIVVENFGIVNDRDERFNPGKPSHHSVGRAIDISGFKIGQTTYNYKRAYASYKTGASNISQGKFEWSEFWNTLFPCLDRSGLRTTTVDINSGNFNEAIDEKRGTSVPREDLSHVDHLHLQLDVPPSRDPHYLLAY